MRIAVITNAFPPEARGGAGQIASDLVDLWREDGADIRVWTHRASWTQKNALYRLVGHLVLEMFQPGYVAEVADWRPDMVVTHNLTGSGLLAVGRWLNVSRIPWVHVLHDVQLFEPSGLMAQDRVSWWQRGWSLYRRAFFGVPSLVVSPTQWLLDAHERRGWFAAIPSTVIANPAPMTRIVNAPTNVVRKNVWVFVGRLDTAKGADFLLALARACPQELFVVIGDGPLRESLAHEPNIECLGQRTRQEVLVLMTSSQGVLVPSRVCENQPTVILEAFSCGIPVIASRVGGIPETVGLGGICLPLEIQAWRDALRDRAAFCADGRLGVVSERQRFSVQAVALGWREAFSRMMSDRRQTP